MVCAVRNSVYDPSQQPNGYHFQFELGDVVRSSVTVTLPFDNSIALAIYNTIIHYALGVCQVRLRGHKNRAENQPCFALY